MRGEWAELLFLRLIHVDVRRTSSYGSGSSCIGDGHVRRAIGFDGTALRIAHARSGSCRVTTIFVCVSFHIILYLLSYFVGVVCGSAIGLI